MGVPGLSPCGIKSRSRTHGHEPRGACMCARKFMMIKDSDSEAESFSTVIYPMESE